MNVKQGLWVAAAICVGLLACEIFVRACDPSLSCIDYSLLCSVCSCVSLSALLALFVCLVQKKVLACTLSLLFMLGFAFVALLEICTKSYFENYYLLSYIFVMAPEVIAQFADTVFDVLVSQLPVIFALFAILGVFGVGLAYVLVRTSKTDSAASGQMKFSGRSSAAFLSLCALALLLNFTLCKGATSANGLQTNFSANEGIAQIGLLNTLELEAFYTVFGYPQSLPSEVVSMLGTNENSSLYAFDTLGAAANMPFSFSPAVATQWYNANMLDIDFTELARSTEDKNLKSMDAYFMGKNPA